MPHGLASFAPSELRLTRAEARGVLDFFFPGDGRLGADDLTNADLSFAQGLLVAALAEGDTAGRPPAGPDDPPGVAHVASGWVRLAGLVPAFLLRANPAWFPGGAQGLTPEMSIGEPTRAGLSIRYRAIWLARQL